MKNNKKGFTIVELVIVVAIIAILAAVLIPTFASIIKKANESVDIQAARNMNVQLAAAKYTDGVNSILDVYDAFEDSGYSVENYKPLAEGTLYFYDKGYNQILYVDSNGIVIYPEEHKGETSTGREWFSLNMEIEKTKPNTYSTDSSTITATVTKGEELAYVVDEYNKAADGTALTLTVSGTIDMKGAAYVIESAKGDITITGENNAVIKNITSNKFYLTSDNNSSHITANYQNAAVIATIPSGKNVTIENVTFENFNVKSVDAGNIGLICGSVYGKLTLDGVSIKDSTVIGGRSVAAVAGAIGGNTGDYLEFSGNITLDNVYVGTTQGRSSIIANSNLGGYKVNSGANISVTNCSCRVYLCPEVENEILSVETTSYKNASTVSDPVTNPTCKVYSLKTIGAETPKYIIYCHTDDALFIKYTSGASPERTAIMTVDDFVAGSSN